MNAVAVQQRAKHFLPQITTNRSKRTQSSQCRLQQEKTLQTESLPDKSTQILSKPEIDKLRNSLKQNICVELLQAGYHRSYSELFTLLRTDHDRRKAEPASAVEHQVPLEEHRAKLETIKLYLSRAEEAERKGSWSTACECRLFLGQYFSAPEDQWLSFHFYKSCTDRALGGRSRSATEARACMAELYRQQGKLEEARQQAELCIEQAEDAWLDSAGQPLRHQAHKALWRIYSRLADIAKDTADYSKALTLLHKGCSMATESGDKQMEGEVFYQLGLTYQRTGDHDTAKEFFNTCMQICCALQDADGLGKCYKAMANYIERDEDIDETVQWLQQLVDISISKGLQHNLADAYLCLGNIYYSRHQYNKACDFFLQGYEVVCKLEDAALLQKTQVLVASARAHLLLKGYIADVELATPAALQRLLAWKDTREQQELGKDSTDSTASVSH